MTPSSSTNAATAIPVSVPDLQGNEAAYVMEAIQSSWISSTGKFIDQFEREFATLCGARTALSVSNGTVALHLALLGLDLRPGDEVLVPSLTYVATANAVRYMGAEPVFIDVDPETWCMDPKLIEAAITRRTKGIIVVHLYGHPADMDAINHLAAVHGLWVVEDAAEAHLATYKGRPVGGLGDLGTFSFYGNKIFTSGEGGAVTVNNPQMEVRLRALRGQGVDPARRYYFPITGYNFRLTNVACAFLCAQLERRDQLIARRREIFALYRERLAGVPGLGFQPQAAWAHCAPWLFCLLVDAEKFGLTRDQLQLELAQQQIDTRPFFIPLHTLPPFREGSRQRGEKLPWTEQLAATGMNLPTYTNMTNADVIRVADAIAGLRR